MARNMDRDRHEREASPVFSEKGDAAEAVPA